MNRNYHLILLTGFPCSGTTWLGEEIKESNVRSVRPGFGMPPRYYNSILGKKVKRNLEKGDPLKQEDIMDWTPSEQTVDSSFK